MFKVKYFGAFLNQFITSAITYATFSDAYASALGYKNFVEARNLTTTILIYDINNPLNRVIIK